VLTFEDLLAAKVAIQMERLSAEGARAALQAALAGNRTFVQELERAGKVDAATARTIAGHARRCSFLKAESVYAAYLRQRNALDEPTIQAARTRQRQEGLRARMGDLLVQEGKLPRDLDQAILADARTAFVADNAQVTEKYAAKGFEGIERPSSTVSEVLGQAFAPGSEATSSANPYDSARGGLAPVAPRAVARADQGLPPAASQDGAIDLRRIGHSQELGPNSLRFLGAGEAIAAAAAATAAAPAAPSPLTGTGLETRYEVVKKLGEGGMGAVYLAREVQGGRNLALKLVLDREKSQEAAARFKREILATSMCGHENVIEIYDAGDTKDGSYFMAMEYVPGEELADIIKREGAVAVPRALDFFDQILDGIGAVHAAGIVHRDLKPQNFRIHKDPATGRERVKIMDFGIARIKDAEQQFPDQFYRTMGGKITGSPAYLAPESITEAEVDHRADLYSLGIALFRIVTGKLPFTCKEAMEYLPKHLYERPPVPSQFTPERKIPPELDAVILRLLSKLPAQRFASAEEVKAEIAAKVRPVLPALPTSASTAKPITVPDIPPELEVTSRMPSSGAAPAPAPSKTPSSPRAPAAVPTAETLEADPKALEELARGDAGSASSDALAFEMPGTPPAPAKATNPGAPPLAPAPAPAPVATAPAEKKGCLGFLFGKKKA
jgi:serine/threonine protein kinase